MDENNIVEWDRYGGESIMIWGGILVCHDWACYCEWTLKCSSILWWNKSSSLSWFLFLREKELTFCRKTTLAAMLLVTQCSALLQQSNIQTLDSPLLVIRTLINSLRRRCAEVLKHMGGHTGYWTSVTFTLDPSIERMNWMPVFFVYSVKIFQFLRDVWLNILKK